MNSFNLRQEHNHQNVWRYLDLSKFLDLLENSKIFFPKVTLFEDPLEGVHNAVGKDDHYDITNEGTIIRLDSPGDERQQENSQKFKEYFSNFVEAIKDSVGVSCWRMSNAESHAMWKVFLKSDEGIAVRTTVEKLKNSLTANDTELTIGRVEYLDYRTIPIPITNAFNALFYKNIYFNHEQELRVLAYKKSNANGVTLTPDNFVPLTGSGIEVDVDVSGLIEEVIVGPYAPKWFFDLICKIGLRYNLQVPIRSSIVEIRR